MPINAPAYNPELNTDQSGTLKSNIVRLEKYVQIPQQNVDESNLPFLSLSSSNEFELATEINRKKLQELLRGFVFIPPSLDKLCENEPLFDDLYYVQNTIPSYFDDYELILDYFIDPEEDSESFTIIVKTTLGIEEALDQEDLYFEEVFDKIYTVSEGKVTFKVQPNGI